MAAERISAAERGLDAAEATLVAARLNLDRQQQLHQARIDGHAKRRIGADGSRPGRSRSRARPQYAQRRAAGPEATVADRMKVENDYEALVDDANATRASATAALRPIETRLARQTTQEIVAPRDGVILRLLAQPGSEMLQGRRTDRDSGARNDQNVVELWVNGNDMPLLHAGTKSACSLKDGRPSSSSAGHRWRWARLEDGEAVGCHR